MQQTLSNSFKCHTTRRRTRIGSHNLDWSSVECADLVDLLVGSAMQYSHWQRLLTLRQISRAFRSMVNAKLDKLLAEFRALADASRLEHSQLTETHPMPQQWWRIPEWVEAIDAIRIREPTDYSAYAAYRTLLGNCFRPAIADRLAKYNHTTGFWLHRDELLAWRLEACVKCHGEHRALDRVDASDITGRMWMAPCHSGGTGCCPVAEVANWKKARNYAERVASTILKTRPHTRELSELLQSRQYGQYFWAMPILGVPTELTLLGASGMDRCDVERLVATEEAKEAQAATDRKEKRTAKRDDEVAKLEAVTEAYLSTYVPSIQTLERLHDLEDRYKLEHAIPRRPLPSHRKLPLYLVRFTDRMRVFHQNILLLS